MDFLTPYRGRNEVFLQNYSELKNKVNLNAALFNRLFDDNHLTLQMNVHELQMASDKIKMIHKEYELFRVRGPIIGLWVMSMTVMSLFGPYPEVGAAMALCFFVSAGSVIMSLLSEETQCVKKVDVTVNKFRQTALFLKKELEKVMRSCEDLRRETRGCETANLMRVEISILELFLLIDGLRASVSADCITDMYNQCRKVMGEFEKMKIRFLFYGENQ